MLNKYKNFVYKKIYRKITDRPISNKLKKKLNFVNHEPAYFYKRFGNKNINKLFYVIKIYEKNKEGGGLFSNLLFILRHLIFAENLKAIPVIDLENFYNRYNEKSAVFGEKNSWLYYFEPVSKYTLNEVYQSQNVLITNGFFSKNMKKNYHSDKNLIRIFKKYIKIKKKFLKSANYYEKENFLNKKVLGVHLRGTDRKTTTNHPFPPTITQMYQLIDDAINKYKFNKIFLITDQEKYLKLFQIKYKNLLCFRKETFRSNQSKIFDLKVRKNHRYEIGRDNIEEMLILSKLEYLICTTSNLSQASCLISKNNINYMEVEENGWNSDNLLIAQIKFYVRDSLPYFLGGFKKRLILKFKKFR
tara:strand:+ start:26 stop:1102 length:1077 start_codon:yes stop_codon:yes gene_type:complete